MFDGRPKVIIYQSSPIDGRIKNLYKALNGNPDLVCDAIEELDKFTEASSRTASRDVDILETEFVKKINDVKILGYENGNNIVDVFINLAKETTQKEKDANYEKRIDLLYQALFDVVEEIVSPYNF